MSRRLHLYATVILVAFSSALFGSDFTTLTNSLVAYGFTLRSLHTAVITSQQPWVQDQVAASEAFPGIDRELLRSHLQDLLNCRKGAAVESGNRLIRAIEQLNVNQKLASVELLALRLQVKEHIDLLSKAAEDEDVLPRLAWLYKDLAAVLDKESWTAIYQKMLAYRIAHGSCQEQPLQADSTYVSQIDQDWQGLQEQAALDTGSKETLLLRIACMQDDVTLGIQQFRVPRSFECRWRVINWLRCKASGVLARSARKGNELIDSYKSLLAVLREVPPADWDSYAQTVSSQAGLVERAGGLRLFQVLCTQSLNNTPKGWASAGVLRVLCGVRLCSQVHVRSIQQAVQQDPHFSLEQALQMGRNEISQRNLTREVQLLRPAIQTVAPIMASTVWNDTSFELQSRLCDRAHGWVDQLIDTARAWEHRAPEALRGFKELQSYRACRFGHLVNAFMRAADTLPLERPQSFSPHEVTVQLHRKLGARRPTLDDTDFLRDMAGKSCRSSAPVQSFLERFIHKYLSL